MAAGRAAPWVGVAAVNAAANFADPPPFVLLVFLLFFSGCGEGARCLSCVSGLFAGLEVFGVPPGDLEGDFDFRGDLSLFLP